MSAGRYADACSALDASQKLEASTATLVLLADCREKNKQYATAWGHYLQAERELRAVTDPNGIKLRELVKTRAASLEPRLSTLTIKVATSSQIPQLEVLRGDERVDSGAWNQKLPVDGGTFRVSARAPERREWSTTVTVAIESDAQAVDIPALASSVAMPPVTVEVPEEVETSNQRPNKLPLYVGGAALGVSAAALGFELWGRNIYSDAKAASDPDRQKERWEAANTRRYVAIGLGVTSVACAGVAVLLYVRGRQGESAKRVAITPTLGGLQLDARW